MSNISTLGSERVAVAAVIAPASLGTGANNTGWIDMAAFTRLLAIIKSGVLGASATVDAKWQLADDAAGTNTVDSTQNALTQVVKATGDNKVFLMNFDGSKSKPYTKRFVRLAVTVGAAASLADVTVLGMDPRHRPASVASVAAVAQTV